MYAIRSYYAILYVDASAGGEGDGRSWSGAFTARRFFLYESQLNPTGRVV